MAISDVPNTTIAGYPSDPLYLNFGWSYSATASIYFIKPIYYGFSNTIISNVSTFNSVKSSLNKHIYPCPEESSSMSLSITGYGYMYYMYPAIDGIGGNNSLTSLNIVKDVNGFVIHDSLFTSSSAFVFYTINGYHIYRTIQKCSYNGEEKFEFIF
jgi:hypothetical protein